MNEYSTDVLIAGSGVAGATLANLLCRNGIRCIVIDAAPAATDSLRSDTDPRALSITPASASILSSINIWQKLPESRVGKYRRMQVWDANSAGEIQFDAADICEPVIGYIVEQALIEQTLNQAMTFLPDFKRVETRMQTIITNSDGVIVESNSGDRFNAQLLVAADGSKSTVRSLAGLAYARHDYEQQAVACLVTTSLPHDQVARQRFLGSGPLAFLPMADQHSCGIVWSTSPDHARSLLALPDREFCKELQQAFESRLGEITGCGPRSAFGLFRAQAAQYTAERLAMVGDAAHCVHPLAGQGANMGLLDVAVLAQLLLAAKMNNRSIASRTVLRRYERWRKGENYQMMVILDGLKYLFEQDNSLLMNLRGIGLNTVNSAAWVKNLIMKHAMGRQGDLPAIVQQHFSIEMS